MAVFLESAELRAKDRLDIKTDFWRENADRILEFQYKEILKNSGAISNAQMKEKVKLLYDGFNQKRKIIEAQEADQQDLEELKDLEAKVKTRR